MRVLIFDNSSHYVIEMTRKFVIERHKNLWRFWKRYANAYAKRARSEYTRAAANKNFFQISRIVDSAAFFTYCSFRDEYPKKRIELILAVNSLSICRRVCSRTRDECIDFCGDPISDNSVENVPSNAARNRAEAANLIICAKSAFSNGERTSRRKIVSDAM